jgi:hypothetical protein
MKKNAGIVGIVGMIVLVVLVSGCTSSNTNTSNQSSNVTVQINSSTPWNGTLTYNGSDHQINGTGNSNYNLGNAPGSVTIYLKNDNGTGNSTAQLLQGNTVIQTQTTSENQQVVTISHNF